MRLTRVYVSDKLVSGKGVGIPEQSGLHLTRVLRLDAGAPITLFDGSGGEFAATLERDGKKVWARVGAFAAGERESPLELTLLQGIARGERMDLIVQKATELGISRIVPVLAERSVVKADAKQRERKREHWQAIAIAACEQCGRNRVPTVSEPHSLGDAIAALPADSARCLLSADGGESLTTFATRARMNSSRAAWARASCVPRRPASRRWRRCRLSWETFPYDVSASVSRPSNRRLSGAPSCTK